MRIRTRGELVSRSALSTKTVVLIPIAVGINVVGGALCSLLKLPLFLDTIGTILMAFLAGPWTAAFCGFLTNIFLALVANPVYLPYSLVSILCGLVVGYLVRAGLGRKLIGLIIIWLAFAFVNALSAGAVTYFVFGGATGVNATSFLTAALVVATREILVSVMTSALLENLIDKGISLFIAVTIIRRIPSRFASQYLGQRRSRVGVVFDEVKQERTPDQARGLGVESPTSIKSTSDSANEEKK